MREIAKISASGKLIVIWPSSGFCHGCDAHFKIHNNNLVNTHCVPITVLSILHILFHLVPLYRWGKGNSVMWSTLPIRVSLLLRGRAGDRIDYQGEVTAALTAKPLKGVT